MSVTASRADGRTALRITAIYLAVGALWIALSDRVVLTLVFVGGSGLALHLLMLRGLRAVRTAEEGARERGRADEERIQRLVEQAAADVARNQADRQQLEARLRQSQKLEAIGLLAGGVAHDFNNVVTAISGYSELALARLEPDDPVRHEIEGIRQSVERAAGLTRQILAFSRREELLPVPLDLNSVLTDMGRMLPRLLGEQVQLTVRPQAHAALIVADLSQVEQVLLNLSVNARDAMPSGGRLLLQTEDVPPGPQGRARVALVVSDTGTGMDDDTRARIYEPFFTTKPAGQGTGFGLPTVAGIVRQCGGTIACDTAPGRGTTFRIELPLLSPPSGPAVDARLPVGHAASDALTVLVVDDDAQVRLVVRDLLEAAGHRVLDAANGVQALSIMRRATADVVVCDMLMPDKEGIETCAEMRRLYPDVPFLAMSGAAGSANYLRIAVKLGAAGGLVKPFSGQELMAAIARARAADLRQPAAH